MSELQWRVDAYQCLRLDVPIKGYDPNKGDGEYQIIIQRRPHYCDRGDWIIFIDGRNNDIDGADGFPRYFFGSEAEVKQQMETWLNRRRAHRERANTV